MSRKNRLAAQCVKDGARVLPEAGETKGAGENSDAVCDLATIGAEEIRTLAKRLEAELAKRGD